MAFLLLAIPTSVLGVLFIGGVVLLSIAGLLFVRRKVPLHILEAHHDVAGFIIAVIGVVYAVLLAMLIVTVWEQFEEARRHVEQEANTLRDLYYNASAFPGPTQNRLQEQIQAYTRIVVDEEWAAMARGKESEHAWDALSKLWQIYMEIELHTARETIFYGEAIKYLNELGDSRTLRLLASRSTLPGTLVAMLVFGGITTVGFTYFFGLKNTRAQVLMTVALTATIAFVIFVALTMSRPFTGDASVQPKAFEEILQIFERLAKEIL